MIFKLGVTSLDSLDRDRTWLGLPKRFSLRLYGEIIESRPDLDPWLARILERHQSSTGAFKRTADRRFAELDERLMKAVARLRTELRVPLRVHDLGVSDGRSSVELLEQLESGGPVEFNASDRDTRVDIVSDADGRWAVAFDEDGHVVQYVAHGFVVSPVAAESAWLYPLNRLALARFESVLRPRAERLREQALDPALADLERRALDGAEIWRVPLISRRCADRIRSGQIHFVRHDVCQPLEGRFHLLRAMNVLNHLDAGQLARASAQLWAALEDGGLLVVGRTADPGGETRATVWRRDGGTLRVLDRLHGGAELAAEIERGAEAAGPRP